MRWAAIRPFLGFYLACGIVQAVGGYFTGLGVHDWYPPLHKSPLTPPGMYFGIVWSLLYLMMAIAAARIYQRTGTLRSRALIWWAIQLILGLNWSIFFFGAHAAQSAMIILICNLLAAVVTARLFNRIDLKACLLMLPLCAWLGFACHLNSYILHHN